MVAPQLAFAGLLAFERRFGVRAVASAAAMGGVFLLLAQATPAGTLVRNVAQVGYEVESGARLQLSNEVVLRTEPAASRSQVALARYATSATEAALRAAAGPTRCLSDAGLVTLAAPSIAGVGAVDPATPLPLAPDLTTREVVERITEQSGTTCQACHRGLLNPLGFVTENFDAMGRVRTSQRLFSETGSVLLDKPVTTVAPPNVAGHFEDIDDAAELQALMLEGEFQTCFARQYFRYTFQRMEDDVKDACLLESLQQDALAGKPVADVLKAVALAPGFKRRDVR